MAIKFIITQTTKSEEETYPITLTHKHKKITLMLQLEREAIIGDVIESPSDFEVEFT